MKKYIVLTLILIFSLFLFGCTKKERELVITTGESFFSINLIKIQDAIEFNHRINCVEFQKCNLCRKYTNKEPVNVFDLYKYIVAKKGDSIIRNEVDILYRDLIADVTLIITYVMYLWLL